MERKNLLYCCIKRSAFVERDIAIFSTAYRVSVFARLSPKPVNMIAYLFFQFFFLLRKIWKADLLVCQFAGHHSLLPVLFGKIFRRSVLLIPGGSDCVSFPSFNYGQFRKPLLAKTTRWSYRHATHLAPVDESLLFCNYTYSDRDFPSQGIRYFCKNLRTPATVIHNGYEPDKFFPQNETRMPRSFLTVADGCESEVVFRRKGIDLLLELAGFMPECRFTIIGSQQLPVENLPGNVEVLPFVLHEQLPALMSKHEFYLQLSRCEGFPNALCEAMLCGCVPVVSQVAAMPMIVGESGFVLSRADVSLLNALVKKAISADIKRLSAMARQRIAENFTLAKRQKALLRLAEQLAAQR